MPSRHVSLNPFLNVCIIGCPTVVLQLLALSNISSLIKNEGGNTVGFFFFCKRKLGLCLVWVGAEGLDAQ